MPFTPEKNSSTPIDISSMPPAPTDENIVIPPPQHRDDKHEKTTPWYRKPVALIGTGALAAAMVGGGIALSGKSRNAASQPKEPGAAAPADPTASASPAAQETEAAAAIEFTPIDASDLSDPKKLEVAIGAMLTQGDMAGADAAWAQQVLETWDGTTNLEDVAAERAATNMEGFKRTYLAAANLSEPAMQEFLDQYKKSTTQTLYVYMMSLREDPQNVEPYTRKYTVNNLEVVKQSSDRGTLEFVVSSEDNRLMNVGQNMLKGSQTISVNTNKTGYVIIDGKLRFTHFDITP